MSSATWTHGLVVGHKMDMLLVTGLTVMIICEEVWKELKCIADPCELQDVMQNVVTADGSSLELLGQVTLSAGFNVRVAINDIHFCGMPIIACLCSYHNL